MAGWFIALMSVCLFLNLKITSNSLNKSLFKINIQLLMFAVVLSNLCLLFNKLFFLLEKKKKKEDEDKQD